MQNTTPKHFVEKSEKDLLIAELQDKLSAALAKNEELHELVSKLKEKAMDLEEKYLRSGCLLLKTSPHMTHW